MVAHEGHLIDLTTKVISYEQNSAPLLSEIYGGLNVENRQFSIPYSYSS